MKSVQKGTLLLGMLLYIALVIGAETRAISTQQEKAIEAQIKREFVERGERDPLTDQNIQEAFKLRGWSLARQYTRVAAGKNAWVVSHGLPYQYGIRGKDLFDEQVLKMAPHSGASSQEVIALYEKAIAAGSPIAQNLLKDYRDVLERTEERKRDLERIEEEKIRKSREAASHIKDDVEDFFKD